MASTTTNNHNEQEVNGSDQNQNTKLRFEDADELMCDAGDNADVADDITSADYYFDSYSHFGIHEEMLKDVVRTKCYRDVIYKNKFHIKDKIVLDVGAGTGILSLFCAKAGAAHVYAVECSQMADTAKEIVKSNGFSDFIKVLKGKIEEIEFPIPKVDVIISEWMGYFLVYENMLDTVLYARNKWLVDGGIVLPDKASLYLTAIEDAHYNEDKVESPFKLVAKRNDHIHALVAYFDVSFTMCHKMIGFSTGLHFSCKVFLIKYDILKQQAESMLTLASMLIFGTHITISNCNAGPKSQATHWKQTVLYLDDVLTICEGETITGSMTIAPNKKNPRDVDIKLSYSLNGQHCKISRTQLYNMR
ncbi:hypothetical protein EUTSA_v10002025mg [Eutrema salsugineum]|uniref:Uncharacterized protein n=1 Tax=Eutrema salsugineum TaxID=72664 RepID=V4MCV9_EUTSA|nr:hypothetical protein EUTSA_v10002025mg [Eutrema salsugineum]